MSKLTDVAKQIKSAMEHSDTGPLVIAADVVKLAEKWKDYKEDAGKLSCAQWLTRELGNKKRGLAYFRARHRAVEALGEESRRMLHHEMAVYIVNNVPKEQWDEVKETLYKKCVRNNHCPLSPGQARPLIYKIVGHVPGRGCSRCAMLEAELRRMKSAA
jgi:hypothetical protein